MDLRGGTRRGHPLLLGRASPPSGQGILFLWAGQLLLCIPLKVLLGRHSTHIPFHPLRLVRSPPRCFLVLNEDAVKSQAQDIYRQCGLTFLPRDRGPERKAQS